MTSPKATARGVWLLSKPSDTNQESEGLTRGMRVCQESGLHLRSVLLRRSNMYIASRNEDIALLSERHVLLFVEGYKHVAPPEQKLHFKHERVKPQTPDSSALDPAPLNQAA
jgi:hypothetical protein